MTDEALLRYSRQLLLNEWGLEAQHKLFQARVLIIGLGGLGCPAAHHLAAAGVGCLTLVDGDTVDASNLQRQYLHTPAQLGQLKVNSAKIALLAINPHCQINTQPARLDDTALEQAVSQHDLVLDCTDNFASRHAINRACVQTGTPLISGAAIRFDGQLIVFDTAKPSSCCYHCLFPEQGEEDEADRCGVMGVFAPLTSQIGTLQAQAAIKWLTGIGQVAVGELQIIDALRGSEQRIKVPRDAHCTVCAQRSKTAFSNKTSKQLKY